MASGNGSNFENIVNKLSNKFHIELFTENKKAFVIDRAKKLGIKYYITNFKDYKRDEFNNILYDFLLNKNPDLIVLAGYMKILPSKIVKNFKIVNIHPSLLPSFPGVNSIKKAYKYGVKITGITIHWVDEGLDTGKIIEQKPLEISKNDSLEKLEIKIHNLEHETYPFVIEKLLI